MKKLSSMFKGYRVYSITHDADARHYYIALCKIGSDSISIEYYLNDDYMDSKLSIKGYTYNDFLSFMIEKEREERGLN